MDTNQVDEQTWGANIGCFVTAGRERDQYAGWTDGMGE